MLGSMVSLACQLLMAHRFGASLALDAYLIAASIPTALAGLVGATLSFAILPAVIQAQTDPPTARTTATATLASLLAFSAVLVSVGCLSARAAMEKMGDPLGEDLAEDAVVMLQLSWVSAGLLLPSHYLGLLLIARKFFYFPVAAMAMPHVLLLMGLALLPADIGVMVVPSSMLAGASLSFVALLCRARHDLASLTASVHDWRLAGQTWKKLPGALLALSCFSSYAVVDALIAPSIAEGTLSILGYGQRLLIATGNLAVAGPATVLAYFMARSNATQGEAAARSRLLDTVKVTIAIGSAIAVTLAVLARPLVQLALEHGSFDAAATERLAALLPWLLLGMVPMLSSVLLFRGLYQLNHARAATSLGFSWTLLYATLCTIMTPRFGEPAIPIAYAICWWTIFLTGMVYLLWTEAEQGLYEWSSVAVVNVLAVVAVLIVTRPISAGLDLSAGPRSIGDLASIFLVAVLHLAVYLLTYIAITRVRFLRVALPGSGTARMFRGFRNG
jgi:putative peptidoglycan lipid II flippase